MKSAQQVFFDDLWCVNAIDSISCDDFSVDVFLNLSDKDFKDGSLLESEKEEEKDSLLIFSQDRVVDDNSNLSTFSGNGDSGSSTPGELGVPVDDLENLEWLSQFVDDSVSEISLLCPAGIFAGSRSEPGSSLTVQKTSSPCFPSPVPSKARSKRSRPTGRLWSLGSPSSSSSSSTPSLIFANDMDLLHGVGKPVAKKQKRKPAAVTGGESHTQRRCSHCQVQKTPQWRAGPLGPKTLCNACGVRYKSGRLFPEYRPACSPTFSGDIHSNSHRKVLEMRWKKEMGGTESGDF
ncbi:hypothetical protein F0562_028525 [Nyssa sinensis]|uniref:GATA transcription factor n=1 Tax=Nyssa sinensis TaxID=561372 RepID=A0A5J5B2N5_9ASTE|nr:hypothetical protein F0562_028525 [Nyssa sinensis]